MKTKFVYVLVSADGDYYFEMLCLSLYTLRRFHPQDTVVVVMDNDTYIRLQKARASLLSSISVMVIDIPSEYSVIQRSRYLKTSLRQNIDGPFLFIDTDTVICSSLEAADCFSGTICVALENVAFDSQVYRSPNDLNWKYLITSKNYNSGVLFVNDTPEAYLFFDTWHQNWKHSVSFGYDYDQLAFRKAILDTGIAVQELSPAWNCQVVQEVCLSYLSEAKILHFQGSFNNSCELCNEATFLKIRLAGGIPADLAKSLDQPLLSLQNRTLRLKQDEAFAIKPFVTLYQDYPRFFSFLSRLSKNYRFLVTSLYKWKHREQ